MSESQTQKTRAIATHSEQAQEFRDSYETLAQDPHHNCFVYSRRRLEATLARHLPARGDGVRLLDVGCGTGNQMAALQERGFEVAGVDGSEAMLAHARRLNPRAVIREGDVERLPFEDHSFDVALCVEVLRYLETPGPCLREIRRILRPSGLCLVTAAPRFNSNGYFVVNRLAGILPARNLVRLRQFFITARGLRRAMADAGFGDVGVHGVYTGPINWVERLAPRALPGVLRWWEKHDARLADSAPLREFANMFLARGLANPAAPLQ